MEGSSKVTVGQACRDLGVSWHTLSLWVGKLKIETAQHELDERLRMIAAEDVERIRQARESLPRRAGARPQGAARPLIGIPSGLSAARPPGDLLSANPVHAAVRQSAKQPTVSDMGALAHLPHLPEGRIGDREWARRHGVPHMTLRDAIKAGRVPRAEGGPWRAPDGQRVEYALDTSGQAEAYRLYVAGRPDRERTCCPHILPSAAREPVPTVKRSLAGGAAVPG